MSLVEWDRPHFKHDEPSRKACERCGGAIRHYKPCKLKLVRFCSRACAWLAKRESHPARQRKCLVCAGPMKPTGKTCSAACGYELRKRSTRSQRACDKCGALYWPMGHVRVKFCSLKCYRAVQAQRPAFVEATCMQCGAKFHRTIAALRRVKHAFCSRACNHAFHVGEQAAMFRGDKDPNRGAEWNKLAEAIRQRDCYSCRRCGRCQHGDLTKLSVDHVRPWRWFTDKAEANEPGNLVSLCRSCHSYKTTVIERAFLRGDRIPFSQWVRSLHLKSAVKGITVAKDASGEWVVTYQHSLVMP